VLCNGIRYDTGRYNTKNYRNSSETMRASGGVAMSIVGCNRVECKESGNMERSVCRLTINHAKIAVRRL
jgi:hypothetical protein